MASITIGNRSCLLELQPVEVNSLEFVLPTLTLATLNVVVIVGNLLVVAAVLTTHKLRTVTNTFIVSLAVADLFVGVLVLPFSNANEVLRYWVFGPVWCSVWLAVDVWLCTASILNLVAISLDRYLAISKPMKYHNLMTPRRGHVLVTLVWILSFLICFPPLIGWNEQDALIGDRFKGNKAKNRTAVSDDEPVDNRIVVDLFFHNLTFHAYNYSGAREPPGETGELPSCELYYPECGLTSDPGYIVYSALGSFFIPMFIMAFFYWRIYRTAVRTTNALKRGILTMKTSGECDDAAVTLRVHRGGGGGGGSGGSPYAAAPTTTANCHHAGSKKSHSVKAKAENGTHGHIDAKRVLLRETPTNANDCAAPSRVRLKEVDTPSCESPLLSEDQEHGSSTKRKKKATKTRSSVEHTNSYDGSQEYRGDGKNVTVVKKFGKKNFKLHLRKLNKEKKAAKTVGIIVGGFILCWCPFFTVYLIGAFCENCTPPLVFSTFFWLGYCNSAINPCVYALFSRDFRFAFKRLLACRCQGDQSAERARRMGLWSVFYATKFQASSSKGSDSNSE